MKILSDNIRFSLPLVLLGMCAGSCSEAIEEADDIAEVTFTASLRQDVSTRTSGDGRSVDKLIVGVFGRNENGDYSEMKDLRHDENIVNGKIGDITLSLAKEQTYHFVFWAYDGDGGIYDVENLTAIKMKNDMDGFAQAENADAFFATVTDFTVTANTMKDVTLTRPLAQINVGTSGKATAASFTVRDAADTFHPFTGTVSGDVDFTWHSEGTTGETFFVDGTPYTCMATGYVFAPLAEVTRRECELVLAGTGKKTTFPAVELRANHRSNIAGNFTGEGAEDQ